MQFYNGTPRQRGLSAYARYRVPDKVRFQPSEYRISSIIDDNRFYEVDLYEGNFRTDIRFWLRST